MPLISSARYGHTNLIARDWRALAGFYQRVFGCTPAGIRYYTGPTLESGTGVPGASLEGVHLRLPGVEYSGDASRFGGPTLEIFTYSTNAPAPPATANRLGFGHIAFTVDDVPAAHATVLANGGSAFGDIVTLTTPDHRRVTWCYLRDPEGNLIELQHSTDPQPPE